MDEKKLEEQAVFLKNRLLKNKKHLLRWANKHAVYCLRVYDKDIPEIPLCIDLYYESNTDERRVEPYIVLALYKRPYEKEKREEELWLIRMQAVVADVFETACERIFFKLRQKRKDDALKYDFSNTKNEKEILVREGAARFKIKLNDLLDTGLFLDHRFLRRHIFQTAQGKSVLNLFCYTGSFSVQAKLGGARRITSVDLSKNYLDWAKENFHCNGLNFTDCDFIASDVFEFLRRGIVNGKKSISSRRYDIIICDAPTFSNSKKTETVLDINRDWQALCTDCLQYLANDGIFYFSCNSKSIKINREILQEFEKIFFAKNARHLFIKDLSVSYLDEDFKNKKPHTLISFAYRTDE